MLEDLQADGGVELTVEVGKSFIEGSLASLDIVLRGFFDCHVGDINAVQFDSRFEQSLCVS